jgi:group I intron endonuclease
MIFFIYLIFNTKNGKMYIGKTNDLHIRWITHKRVAKGGKDKYHEFSVIHQAIVKYGVENFEFLCIQDFKNENEAYLAEIYWINFYNTRNSKFGYNVSPGGIGSGSGINSANFGLKRSLEVILKLSNSHKGERNQNYGKIFSQDTRLKMSKSQKGNQLGEKHGMAILNEEIVRNLKIDYVNLNLSKKDLSIKYNIKYNNVISILNGYSWKHVKI